MTWNPFGRASDKDSVNVSKAPPPPPAAAPVVPTIPPSIPPNPSTIPQEVQLPHQPQQLTERQKYVRDMGYKTAVVFAVVCPVLIFMPPRKMDFYTFGLIFTTAYCVNHVMNEHGHPGLLYAIAPKGSMEYQEKVSNSRKKYDNMLPSEAMWAQIKDVWNQRHDDEDDEDEVEEKKESMLDQIRREEAEKPDSSILKMLEEQEKKPKP